MSLRSQQEARDADHSDDYATEVRSGLVSEPYRASVEPKRHPADQLIIDRIMAEAENVARMLVANRQQTVLKASMFMQGAA